MTEGVLTRIHQQGGNPQDTARAAARELAAKGDRVRNPAGFLVRVVLPGIADKTLTASPAPKPTPTPPPVAEITTAARCEHGAELGRCALCRTESKTKSTKPSCHHYNTPLPDGRCPTCVAVERDRAESFRRLALEDQASALECCYHGQTAGRCLNCVIEAEQARKSLETANHAIA